MTLDKETRDNLSEGEKWKHFVEGEMWQKAREKLVNKIMDAQSVNNVDMTDAQKALDDIRARKATVEMMWEWIQEIEGLAEQHEFNSRAYEPEEIIRHKTPSQ